MKRLTLVLAAVAVAFYLSGTPALAQHGHGGGGTGHGPSAGGPSGHPGSGAEPGKPSSPGSPNTNSSVSTRLAHNDKLADKLEKLTGDSLSKLQSDCSVFKNLGRCVSAVHVWHNLGFDKTMTFTAFRDKILAEGGLGKAIHALDPNANAKAEAKKGQRQANDDLKESSS